MAVFCVNMMKSYHSYIVYVSSWSENAHSKYEMAMQKSEIRTSGCSKSVCEIWLTSRSIYIMTQKISQKPLEFFFTNEQQNPSWFLGIFHVNNLFVVLVFETFKLFWHRDINLSTLHSVYSHYYRPYYFFSFFL